MSRVAVLGSGVVGVTLANGLADLGHEVGLGSRSGKTVEGWTGQVGTFAEVLRDADLAVLSVKGSIAEELVGSLTEELAGVTVIDTTNPIADTPPVDGVLSYFTGPNESLMERLQKLAPEARFVKAFNSVGSALMVQPKLAGGLQPTMFLAGDNADAVATVAQIATQFGWEPEIVGSSIAARAIEPLCVLWCIPGLRDNDWVHAFKVLRPAAD